MAALTLAGSPVLAAVIAMPGVGAWVADIEVATDVAPSGRVELTPETGPAWSGTVIEGGVHAGTWRARVVGGAAGLRRELPATNYRNATLQDVLADALREAGETLAAGVDLSSWAVALYLRVARAAAWTVADVARACSAPWRVTRAGAVRVGAETWAPVTLDDVSVTTERPDVRRYELAGSVLGIDPGTSLTLPTEAGPASVLVESVVHRIEGDHVTATVWAP